MINCEIGFDLLWWKVCIISEISTKLRIPANSDANSPVPEKHLYKKTGVISQINNAKIYVPFLTLSINDNINFLEKIKPGFKRANIDWKKQCKQKTIIYISYYLTFRSINRLFVSSFKNDNDDSARNSFGKYYMPLEEIP